MTEAKNALKQLGFQRVNPPPQLKRPAFFTGRTPHRCLSGVWACMWACTCIPLQGWRIDGIHKVKQTSRTRAAWQLGRLLNISRETVHSSSLCVAVGRPVRLNYNMSVQRVVRSRCADTCLCFLQLKKRGGWLSAQEFKRGAFNLCQKSTDSSETDSEEGLESTSPDHEKHVRTTRRAHMERQARTHTPRGAIP